VNKHWHVRTADAQYVLRRYRIERSPAAIDYEHNAIGHAATKGWPVATAIKAMDGRRVVEVAGRRYSLFHRLPGRAAPYTNLDRSRLKGELLARLHRDMASWDAPGQREGYGTAWELDLPVRSLTQYATFNEMLRAFEREHPELARAIRRERYDNLRQLAKLGYGTRPLTFVHGDFWHDNLLFTGPLLTALLDFDLCSLDERVADIAATIDLDCLAPPAYNELHLPAVEAFVSGYCAVTPLDERELALIPALAQAWVLGLVTFQLCGWSLMTGERPLRSIERSVHERFPRLRRNASALEEAIRRAAAI
jgi:Ser/Thr protein kinase RdoA (MazF antagonist)